jgi:hypothetical protein
MNTKQQEKREHRTPHEKPQGIRFNFESTKPPMKIHDYTNPFRSRSYNTKPSGGHGGLNRKNPFRGIACGSQPHWSKTLNSGQRLFRHIEGARDTRPTHNTHHRDQCLRRIFDRTIVIPTHRDSNPIPCVFLP